jgi:hypothetical protein
MVWRARAAALALCVGLLPQAASAEPTPLKTATIAASAAAAADWASTYHALRYYNVRESNPLLRPMDGSPGQMVAVGAMIDAGAISTWNVMVGREHPRIATTGLWLMTGFRAYLAIHNLRNERQAARR